MKDQEIIQKDPEKLSPEEAQRAVHYLRDEINRHNYYYYINHNKEWERIRYLAAMVYNVNATKRSQMISPEKLFSLPQDIYAKMEKDKPKSTKEQYENFMEKVKSSTFNSKFKT